MILFPGTPTWTAKDIPDLNGKVALVTGGNTGIGKITCLELTRKGAKVYLGARTESRAMSAIAEIKKETGSENIEWLPLDLTDLDSVKNAAETIKKKESELHILVNNAGVMNTPFELTKNGFELQWGTNVVGHFVLTRALLPLLLSTASKSSEGTVRVVNVSSYGHNFAPKGGINFDDTKLQSSLTSTRYGQSKLGNILLTKELVRRYGDKGIYSIALHPGAVSTELYRPMESTYGMVLKPFLWFFDKCVFISPENGAINNLYAATSQEIVSKKQNGDYFVPYTTEYEPSSYAKDPELAKKLWTHLESVTKQFE